MRDVKRIVFVLVWTILLPASAFAQATLSGVATDPSGAVLPGVTVEASSPALIEKTRVAITDGRGQYQIVDLRPGTYAVTFTLPGFSVVRRDGIELSGSGVTTINADMVVGAVSEQVTVTGETPIVDIQSTRRQVVLDDTTVNAIPTSRGYGNLLTMITGMQVSVTPGPATVQAVWFTAHGGRGNEGRMQLGGLNVGGAVAGGGSTGFTYDTVNSQEIQFSISGGLGEADIGGPIMNIIPREGGNRYSGQFFVSTSGKWAQSSNLDEELRAAGITEPAALIKNYDFNTSLGGPILRDRIWFYGNWRNHGNYSDVRNLYANGNAGDPTKWSYVEDRSVKGRAAATKNIGAIRLTSAVTPRNKVGFYYDYQYNCSGSSVTVEAEGGCRTREPEWIALGSLGGFGPASSGEAASVWTDREKIMQATWSSPLTNKLLLEAGYSTFVSRFGGQDPKGAITDLIAVTEQVATSLSGTPIGNFIYRALDDRTVADQQPHSWRASASFVTGSHNTKFGLQGTYNITESFRYAGDTRLAYRFNNGVPNQFTMRLSPVETSNRGVMHALYAQDQWTLRRFTLQGALRYEYARSWHPAEGNGVPVAGRFNAAPISFGRVEGVNAYNDITPRMGVTWDIFGSGKTALKVNLGKYLQAVTNEGNYTVNSKAGQLQVNTNRAWTDGNGNFVPDCNLMDPAAQNNLASGGDLCGGWSNLNFGNTFNLTQVNPDVLKGSGVRTWDWQFSTAVQHEIVPRVSAEVGYFRRWFGNFFVTDNLAVGPQDYDIVTIAAPQDPRLPDGGGFPVRFHAIKPDKFGQVQNYYTFESDYGDAKRYWHGVDVDLKARLQNGIVLQGGTSTGRGVRDTCEITAALPEILPAPLTLVNNRVDSCDVTEKWLTTIRGLATYNVPKIDVLVSGVMRIQPNAAVAATSTTVATNGTALAANYLVTTAQVQQLIGRPLAGGAQNTTVNVLTPGQLYPEESVKYVDLRFAKILRFGRTRTDIGIDLYNLFNANTITAFDQTFSVNPISGAVNWLRPTGVQSPRFVRFNVTMDF